MFGFAKSLYGSSVDEQTFDELNPDAALRARRQAYFLITAVENGELTALAKPALSDDGGVVGVTKSNGDISGDVLGTSADENEQTTVDTRRCLCLMMVAGAKTLPSYAPGVWRGRRWWRRCIARCNGRCSTPPDPPIII